MRISRPIAVVIVVLTILPVAYVGAFLYSFFSQTGASSDSMAVFGSYDTMLRLHLGAMLMFVLIPVFFVTHAFKNDNLLNEKKILWVIVLIFGGSIAAVVYWWHYIWRRDVLNRSGEPTA